MLIGIDPPFFIYICNGAVTLTDEKTTGNTEKKFNHPELFLHDSSPSS